MNDQQTILIIDDEDDIREALRDALAAEGFNILEAKDGVEGLTTALEQKPDLILLDVVMPEMNGIDTLKELRKSDWGKDAKVILLTVLDDADSVFHGVKAGSTDYLIKTNWELKDIVKKIKQQLVGYS